MSDEIRKKAKVYKQIEIACAVCGCKVKPCKCKRILLRVRSIRWDLVMDIWMWMI